MQKHGYMQNSEKLAVLQEKVCECTKCPDLVANRTQTVFGVGNPDADIVFCGEGPGKDEDTQGVPFVGRAGKLLTNILNATGLEREDVYILNIVKCRPPGNRNPTPEEAENCRPFLDLQLKVINPKYIVCLGAVASQNLLGVETPIGAMRGNWFDYQMPPVNAKVLCTWHPAYLLRNSEAKKDTWNDLQLLIKEIGKEDNGAD